MARRIDEVTKVLSDLKVEIHNTAVYPNINGIDPYISLKKVDAILSRYIDKYSARENFEEVKI